jgi:hypothetical protein
LNYLDPPEHWTDEGVPSAIPVLWEEAMTKFMTAVALATLVSVTAPNLAAAQGTTQTITAVDVKEIATGLRASKIIGSDVVNLNKDTIGKIDDLIISSDHRLIAVISVGGFLGIGTKLVAVRYDDLQATSNNSGFILPGATKDSLKALPEFSYR